ncbi:hypothetical protein GCM10009785_19890 [Brooklawnia cerclae]|uniref:Uncharacterized protein n=1 Tax=Brooklawnia cerclae TaxID=349934 RepID=A0ABX0SHB1_9ACTN|nr:hypothetical protein [Brooklawnia cerclae]NIH57269.1 hypothetical protein [Brooklawnia cerclae]
MPPFEPLGEFSRRNLALGVLRGHATGDVVGYDEFGDALDLHPDVNRKVIQDAVRAAGTEFLDVDRQALEAVPNVGYRIVPASEHVRLARGLQRQSSRALVRGHTVVAKVDYNALSPEVRALTEATARAFAAQIEFNRRMDVRQQRLEEAVATVATKQERSDDEVAELRERLARLEASIAGEQEHSNDTHPIRLQRPAGPRHQSPR